MVVSVFKREYKEDTPFFISQYFKFKVIKYVLNKYISMVRNNSHYKSRTRIVPKAYKILHSLGFVKKTWTYLTSFVAQ